MKVLVVNTVPMEQNGITNVILNIYRSIDKNRIEMDFVSQGEPSLFFRRSLENTRSKIYILENRLKNPFGYVLKLKKLLKGYDIIHVHGNSATIAVEFLAAKLAGVSVRIAHSHSTGCRYRVVDFILRPLFYQTCTGRLACSDTAGKWLYRKRKFLILKNGIETSKYRFDYKKRLNNKEKIFAPNYKIIGHIGEFNAFKNHNFIIDIFQQLYYRDKAFRLLLIGDGENRCEIERKISKLKLTHAVKLVGKTDSIEEYLNIMDLILMPSLQEGFPLTLLEEQANGLQCLVSDKITEKVNITGNISFLPIDQGVEIWLKKIAEMKFPEDRSIESDKAIKVLIKNGYDSEQMGKELEHYYLEQVK